MSLCNCCPRNCNVDRTIANGVCGVSNEIKVARAGLHFGEEPCISGKNGSGTVFFSGCSLKCVFCQNFDISHESFGKYVSDDRFIEILEKLAEEKAHNINLVTPTHYFERLEQIFTKYKPSIPLVCNSSGYEKIENIEKDVFDVYLFDLKFYSQEKSFRYAGCSDYFSVASAAIRKAVEIKGSPKFNEEGIMTSGVMVRHMILPQNTNESINIIESLEDISENIVFSLMSQYLPMHKASDYNEINRKITKREYNKVLDKCYDANFFDVFVQSRISATKEFIPNFDLTGI